MGKKFWLKAVGYPFVTRGFRMSRLMDWMRIGHAWLGIWGTVACLVFGVSTITLQHPELFPRAQAVTTISSLPAPASGLSSNGELADHVAARMGFITEPIEGAARRRGGMGGGSGAMGPAAIANSPIAAPGEANMLEADDLAEPAGMGRIVRLPTYTAAFTAIGRNVTATYVPGNESIEIVETRQGLIRTMDLLHLGRGAGEGWTLLGDIFSASVVMLALTGFFLWNVFSGARLIGLTVFGAGLGIALYFALAGV